MEDEDQGTDVAGAAGQIEALLRGGKGDEAANDDAGAADAANDGGDDDRPPTDVRDDDGAADAGEGDAGDGEGDDQQQGALAEDEVELEHAGRRYRVPKDLADSVLRQQDYSRKTETLARERELHAANVKRLEFERKAHAELAPMEFQAQNLRQQIDRLSGDTPDPTVDPMGYLSRDKQIRDLRTALDQIQTSVTERRTALQREQTTAEADLQREFLATLARDIPNWGHQANVEITKVLIGEGFTPQQIAELRDPTIVKMAHKIARLSKLEKARDGIAAKKVAANAAPVVKPSASVNQAGASRTNIEKAKARVRATGDVRDASSAILALMRGKRR